jgi:lipid-A-disaccharide synthase
LAVVGITEILPRLPKIYGEFRKLVRAIGERKPDAAVLIDSPAFHFKVARELKRRGIPAIYYVAPQLWAWRSGRVRLVRRYFKKALVIFPFEEQWYRERGVRAEFVGHPLADLEPPKVSREEFAQTHNLNPRKTWIALLPGSRFREIDSNLPVILSAADLMGRENQYVVPLPPEMARELKESLEIGAAGIRDRSMKGLPTFSLTHDARAALYYTRAAVVASGTATVEAAMMGTPMVVVYRVSPLTWALGRPLVHVKNFAMVNLIAGEQVVPELIQANFTAENVAAKLREILPDGPVREKMKDDLARVRTRLKSGSDSRSAADRAADVVLRSLG